MTCKKSAPSSTRAQDASGPRRPPRAARSTRAAAHEIELLLGDRSRQRDLLIEHLHLIQDKYHQISAAHLAALADEMKLSFAEVFETATFYAHFDIVKEGEPDIAPLTIRVCDSLTCAMLGAETLLHELQDKAGPGIRVVRAPCVGRCDTAPAAEVGHHFVDHATVANVLAAAKAGETHAHLPKYVDYDAYVAGGGYALLNRLRSGAACERRSAEGARRCVAARARRRRLPDGTQMARGARRARAAADGDQWRRGRARYLQGPLLPRNRSASFSRGHADRRACGRGDRRLHLSARRISGLARNPRTRNRKSSRQAVPCCICAAAPAPTSAARNPRCWKASRASAGCRGTSRLIRSRSACSACRR